MEPPRLIATALPEELRALLRRMRDARRARGAFFGLFGGGRVRLACTGSGPRRAAQGLDRLLTEAPASLVIGAGLAGALTTGLVPGDVVVGRWISDSEGEVPASDPAWCAQAARLGAREAAVVSLDRIVTRAQERHALAGAVPADALGAVDMESASWSRVASRHRTPCLIVRVISDGWAEDLPDFLAECLDAEGALSRRRVVVRALGRPGSLRHLLRLRRQARQAASRLSRLVEELLLSCGGVVAGRGPA